jgi:hypothetical protein
LAPVEANTAIRDFLVALHKSHLPNVAEMRIAAKATGLSLSTVNQATSHGKGSAITHGLLICCGMGISSVGLSAHLPKFKKFFAGAEKYSVLDETVQKALRVYSVDEVIIFLEMMLAKDRMERSLGLKKKAGRPSKKTPSS